MEDRRIDRVPDDHRLRELEPELAVLLEAQARLEHRRVRQIAVDLDDAASVPSSKPR